MKKDQKNMFHNIIISLIIVVMVLFLCEPVNAQDSNFPYSTMQDGYGQFLSSYWSGPSFMPGADLMISYISPAPLEYYDSSWRDVSYWHNVGGRSTTWGDPVSYQVIDNDQHMAGAYFSPTQPSCPPSALGVSLLTDGWWSSTTYEKRPVVYGDSPDLYIDLRGGATRQDVLCWDEFWWGPHPPRQKRTWNDEWLYPPTPTGSVRSLYQRPL